MRRLQRLHKEDGMISKIIVAVVALTPAAYCEVKGDTVLSGAM